MDRAIDVGPELCALVINPHQRLQREHLVPARVGQHQAGVPHEALEAAAAPDGVGTRPLIQVVRVREDDPRVEALEILGG